MTVYKFCPRCLRARRFDEGCRTTSCIELEKSPTHLSHDLERNLQVARAKLAEGNSKADWAAVIRELEEKLMLFDAHRGAAAFKQ